MKYLFSSITGRIPWLASLNARNKDEVDLSTLLIEGSVGIFVLKIISTGLGFVISLMLARLLGAKGLGIYAYAFAWVGLLGVPSVLGLDKLLVRNIAAYHTQSAWGMMRGLLRRANQMVLIISLGLALVAAGVAGTLIKHFDSQILSAFWIALIMLPLSALTRLRQAAIQGLHRVVLCQLPEILIQPLVFMALVGAVYLIRERNLSPHGAVGLQVVSASVVFLIGTGLLYKILPRPAKDASPVYQTRLWIRSALPLLLAAGMQIIIAQTDIIMLGSIKGTEAAGVYAVANRLAFLIVFVMMSVNTVLAPTISHLYISQDITRLQSIVTKAARITLAASLVIWILLIFFGSWLLSLFGVEFIKGQAAMSILSTGLVVCTPAASVGLLLSMTRYEKDLAWVTGLAAMTNIILNGILIPKYSIEGAAIATSISLILSNAMAFLRVYKRLGINPSIFGDI